MSHGDIKPHNMVVNDEGKVTLVDFGSAIFADKARYLFCVLFVTERWMIDCVDYTLRPSTPISIIC